MSWQKRRNKGCSFAVCYTPTLATWSNITKIFRSATLLMDIRDKKLSKALLMDRDQKLSKVKQGIVDG